MKNKKNNKKHRRIVKNAMQQSADVHNQLESCRRTLEFFQQLLQRRIDDGEKVNLGQLEATAHRVRYEARMFVELQAKAGLLGIIINN